MSNIMHKVKDAVTGHHDQSPNKTEQRYDTNQDSTTGGYGDSTNTYGSGTGKYSSGSDQYDSGIGSGGYGSGTGKHTSGSNTFDSGVGSGGYNAGSRRGQPQSGQFGAGDTYGGGSGGYGSGSGNTFGSGAGAGGYDGSGNYGGGSDNAYGSRSSNNGPHNSKLANKLDPRVDSDMDNRARGQGYGSSNLDTSGNPRMSNQTRQQDFGFDAFGDSSYNNPTSDNQYSSNYGDKLGSGVDSGLENRNQSSGTQRQW